MKKNIIDIDWERRKKWIIAYPTKEAITKFFNELREDMKTNPFWDKYRKLDESILGNTKNTPPPTDGNNI